MKRFTMLFFPLWLVLGCNGAGEPLTFDQVLQGVDKAAAVAEQQGVAWHATVSFDGRPQVYQEAALGIDTGIRATVHFQGNAQSETAEDETSPD